MSYRQDPTRDSAHTASMRRAMSMTMTYMTAYALMFALSGGFQSRWGIGIFAIATVGWLAYSTRRHGGRAPRLWSLGALVFVGSTVWAAACTAYVIHWNPHGLPAPLLLGAIAAAAPIGLIAFAFRRRDHRP